MMWLGPGRYFWDSIKLQRIAKILSAGEEWAAAADLSLWCLQGDASRRPGSVEEILGHKFFDAENGALRFLRSTDESWNEFVRRQAADLHAAIDGKDGAKLRGLMASGAVDVQMIDESIDGSTARPLHRAAFAGDTEVMRALLDEIHDSWPAAVKREFLDRRTELQHTAYMIASR